MMTNTAPATPQHASTRPARGDSSTLADEAVRLSQALYDAVLTAPPRRAALMTATGERKYSDAPKGHPFTIDDVRDHLAGRRTWAVTLADRIGMARAGCRDYDDSDEATIVAALSKAQAIGLVAFGIVMTDATGEHSGGHVWAFYRRDVLARDIQAQLATLPAGKGEIYPSGNPIRLPLGLHRRKEKRGTLLLQDGRRFDLDKPPELAAALRVILALKRNDPPPPAPEGTRASGGGAFGANHDPAAWENLPDGAALMAAPRYQALFHVRPQLATLAQGRRVVLKRDGIDDDTDSAQVAALVSNLLTTCRKGQQEGQGAPPLAEIRAIALHWKPALRDSRSPEHYRAHVDYEIARYTPEHYTPEPTGYIPDQRAGAPGTLQEAQHRGRGRPAGQCAAQQDLMVELVAALPDAGDGWRETTRAQIGQALGCGVDMVSKYLASERGARIETKQRQHGIALRLVINSPAAAEAEGCNRPPLDRTTTPQTAGVSCMETHSARGGASGVAALPSFPPAAPAVEAPATNTAPASCSAAPCVVPGEVSELPHRDAGQGDTARAECVSSLPPPVRPTPAAPRVCDVAARVVALYPRKRFDTLVRLVLDNCPAAVEGAVRYWVGKAREDQQRQRQIDRLQTMAQPRLVTLHKQLDRILLGGADGPEGACYGWACWLSPHVSTELERRGPILERLKPRGKRRRGRTVEKALAHPAPAAVEPPVSLVSQEVIPLDDPRPAELAPILVHGVERPNTETWRTIARIFSAQEVTT